MHLRPDRLRAHAALAADMVGALEALGRAPTVAVGDGGIDAEPIDTVVLRARRELTEIEAALRSAAAAAEAADHAALGALLRAAERT